LRLKEFTEYIKRHVDPEPKVTFLNFVAIVEYTNTDHQVMTVAFTESGESRPIAINGELVPKYEVPDDVGILLKVEPA
jgi:hypothetical protein